MLSFITVKRASVLIYHSNKKRYRNEQKNLVLDFKGKQTLFGFLTKDA